MCRFLKTHAATEEASFYDSHAGSTFDLGTKPKSKQAYHDCIAPFGAGVPAWAAAAKGAPPAIPPIIITPFNYQGPAPAIDPRKPPPSPPITPPSRPAMSLALA